MKQFKTESKRILDLMINSIYTNKEIFLREFIHDHMALCHVLQSQADTEFFRDTDRSEDIVCLMGMGF